MSHLSATVLASLIALVPVQAPAPCYNSCDSNHTAKDQQKAVQQLHDSLLEAEKNGPALKPFIAKTVTFSYPETWTLVDPSITLEWRDLLVTAGAPIVDEMVLMPVPDPAALDTWKATEILLAVMQPRNPLTLEQVAAAFERSSSDYLPDATQGSQFVIPNIYGSVAKTDATLLGQKALCFSFESERSGERYANEAIYTIVDGRLYGLELSVTKADLERGQKTLEQLATSLKVRGAADASSSSSARSTASSSSTQSLRQGREERLRQRREQRLKKRGLRQPSSAPRASGI